MQRWEWAVLRLCGTSGATPQTSEVNNIPTCSHPVACNVGSAPWSCATCQPWWGGERCLVFATEELIKRHSCCQEKYFGDRMCKTVFWEDFYATNNIHFFLCSVPGTVINSGGYYHGDLCISSSSCSSGCILCHILQ